MGQERCLFALSLFLEPKQSGGGEIFNLPSLPGSQVLGKGQHCHGNENKSSSDFEVYWLRKGTTFTVKMRNAVVILVKPILVKATGSVISEGHWHGLPPTRGGVVTHGSERLILWQGNYICKRQNLSMSVQVFSHFCSLFWVWTFSLDFNLQ